MDGAQRIRFPWCMAPKKANELEESSSMGTSRRESATCVSVIVGLGDEVFMDASESGAECCKLHLLSLPESLAEILNLWMCT